jgi:hypothetical protein
MPESSRDHESQSKEAEEDGGEKGSSREGDETQKEEAAACQRHAHAGTVVVFDPGVRKRRIATRQVQDDPAGVTDRSAACPVNASRR